jgi:hypothetical protein
MSDRGSLKVAILIQKINLKNCKAYIFSVKAFGKILVSSYYLHSKCSGLLLDIMYDSHIGAVGLVSKCSSVAS